MHARSNDPLPSSTPEKLPPRRVGLTYYAEKKLKQRLRRRCPSEPWVEAQIKSASDVSSDGQSIVYRYHDKHVFPPGGANTKMIRCPQCGVFTPPNAIEHGACLDHASHQGWSKSPSAVAIAGLRYYRRHVEQCELLAEDWDSLRLEIEQHKQQENA